MKIFNMKIFSLFIGFMLIFNSSSLFVFADNTEWEDTNPGIKDEQTAEGDLGMVVSAHPLASEVGAQVLRDGGNAVDAAVAMQFALNVAEPMMSGIGGGGFMMYYDSNKEDVSIINSRERAPAGATPDMFLDKDNILTGTGGLLIAAAELSPKEGGSGEFHIGEVSITDLDEDKDKDKDVFHYDFLGEENAAWDTDKFNLDERGTTFTLDEEGGKITFGDARGTNKSSYGLTTAKFDPIENSELYLKFKTDDPGDDKRLRIWVRADEFRSGSTFAKNGFGIEIETMSNTLKIIQSKDSKTSDITSITMKDTTDWQNLRFNVEDNHLKVRLWDSETEPSDWDIDEILHGVVPPFQDRVQNGKSVGVPGTLKGLEVSLNKWGSNNFSMDELMQPAIIMAEEGVKVNWAVAAAIENNSSKLSKTAAKDVFLPNGTPLKEGDLLVQKDLAKTFKLIAKNGTDAFYNGEIGEAIAEEVQTFGGSMVANDLKGYDVTNESPVRGSYKGYDIVTMPPPSSGGLTMLQLLKMSELINLTEYEPRSFEKYHYLVESMHLAYADRAKYMGDPEYTIIPEKGLLNPEYIQERVKSIDPGKANSNVQPGNPWDYQDEQPVNKTVKVQDEDKDKEEGETTHFTVADRWGNMVSYTTTIEQLFGSGIMVSDYGILLNNEMTDFDAIPGGVNEIRANKRPLSSMTPTIVLKDGQPFMTVGSPGGATIITSVTQTIMNAIGYDMELKDAIEEPRIYSNSYPTIRWENGIPKEVRDQLSSVGHVWEKKPVDIGNVNSILSKKNKLTGNTSYIGAADSTREGVAIGINSKIDKSALQERVDEINSNLLDESAYTESSWKELQDAIRIAEAILNDNDATQAEVDSTLVALSIAFERLVEEVEEVDKLALENRVDTIDSKDLDESIYTKLSWQAFQKALRSARAVLNDTEATQAEVDNTLVALNTALDGLVEKEGPVEEVDKSALKNKVNAIDAKNLDKSDYLEASWKVFQNALQSALAVLNDPEATQIAVDDVLEALTTAHGELEKKVLPSGGIEKSEDSSDEEKVAGKRGGVKLPSTATSFYNLILIGFAFICSSIVFWKVNRRRVNISNWL